MTIEGANLREFRDDDAYIDGKHIRILSYTT